MANTQGQVTKIYQLKTLGYGDLSKQLKDIADKFDAIKKAKKEAEGAIADSKTNEDLNKYKTQLQEIKLQEADLRKQRQQMINDAKAEQIARQNIINQQKEEKKNAEAAAGSYAALYQEYKQLYDLVKKTPTGSAVNFKNETLSYDQAITKLKSLATAEQNFRRQFSQDGLLVGEYTSGIVQAFKKMGLDDLIGGQITKAQGHVKDLNAEFDRLKSELKQTQAQGKSTDSIERQMIANRNSVIAVESEIVKLNPPIRGFGDIGNQVTSSISKGFKDLTGNLASFLFQFIAVQAAITKISQAVQGTAQVSDSVSDLEVNMGLAKGGADRLVDSLKKINTRTSLQGLLDIADVALKAGVANENILSVTEAIDKVKIAFGKDFGSVEEGTETFVKLINIFYTDGQITGDRILKIGNTIRQLANSTSASVPFITDFAGRMAGLKQISNVSLPDIIGLGAGFEQFKQSAETSSTTLVKVIPKLASNVERFAQVAGLTKKQFSDLLNNNPAEALIKISEALVKNGKGIEDVSAALADSELGSGRIATILATLGGKADTFRDNIKSAGQAIQDTTALTDAFDRKNNNLASTFDKINKKFTDLAGQKKFADIIQNIASLLLILTGIIINIPFPLLIAGITVLVARTNTWIGSTLRLITAIALEKTALLIQNIQLGVANTLMNIYTATTIRAATATGAAAIAYRILAGAITFLTSPLGIATGLIIGLTTFVGVFSSHAGQASKSVNDLAKSQSQLNAEARINMELSEKIAASSSDQIARIKQLTELVKNQAASDTTRKKALQELISISPKYREALQGEKIDIDKVTEASNSLIDSIQKQARARAIADLTAEKEKKIFEEESKLSALGPSVLKDELGAGAFVKDLASVIGIGKGTKGFQIRTIQNQLNDDRRDLQALYDLVKGNTDIQNAIVSEQGKPINFQDKPTKASKLTGAQKDAIKDIEAIRDRLNAVDEKRRTQNEIDEETYLQTVYATNVNAINQKLKLLKGANAEERKTIAELNLEKVKLAQDVNDKLYDIQKQYLQNSLDDQIKTIKEQDQLVQDNVNASPQQKAQSKLNADKAILDLQIKFNKDIDKLEKDYGQHSLKNAKEGADAVRALRQQILKDEKDVALSTLSEIDSQTDKVLTDIKLKYDKLINDILNNAKKSPNDKKAAIEVLIKTENVETAAATQQGANRKVQAAKVLLDAGLITKEEYEKIYAAAVKGQQELNDAIKAGSKDITTFKQLLESSLSKLFGFAENSDKAKLLGQTIADAFDLAKTAMDDYYQSEADNIKRSADLQVKRLETEKEQRLARASSQAEQDSINKQYAAKEDAVNKEAFEKNKKLQREQAKINLAIQLSNLAVVAFAPNPQNIATLGVAGAIMYAIQAAIAIANYALNIKRINSAQYARGGSIAPTRTGGEVEGPSHAQGGVPFEAEGKELFIINKNSAQDNTVRTLTGTNKQIASLINQIGGGITFAAGAKQLKFASGGYIGQNLQPPVYSPGSTFVTAGVSKDDLKQITDSFKSDMKSVADETKGLAIQISKRVDRLKVEQVTKTVTDAQRKQVKQSAIGTL